MGVILSWWPNPIDVLILLWEIAKDSRLEDAKREANMWQNWFWVSVIIIVVLVFIIIRNRQNRE